jgi:hypothetical protein
MDKSFEIKKMRRYEREKVISPVIETGCPTLSL